MTGTSLKGQKWVNAVQTGVLALLMLVLVYFLGRQLVGGLGLVVLLIGVVLIGLQIFRNPSRLSGVVPLEPNRELELYEIVGRLAARAGLATSPRLFLIPSPIPNAFTFGNREQANIFITYGLANRLDRREMTGVLAHEISHIEHNDLFLFRFAELVRQTTTLLSRFGWLLMIFAVPVLLFSGGAFPFALLAVLIGAPIISLVLQLALFRTREFNADLGAAELTKDPGGLASALYKIERPGGDLLSMLFPVPRREESSLLRTHPATEERIRRLERLSASSRWAEQVYR